MVDTDKLKPLVVDTLRKTMMEEESNYFPGEPTIKSLINITMFDKC